MRKRAIAIVLMSFVTLVIFGSGKSETPTSNEKPIVAVSILPQAFFVDKIAGDLVETVVLVGEGQDPHSYEPSPSQMAQLAKSKLWVLSGTDFERALVDKISSLYPSLAIIDGTEGMTFRQLEAHVHEGETPDPQATAEDLNIDRHTWLGWAQSEILIQNTEQALIENLGLPKDVLDQRTNAFLDEIDTLFTSLKQQLSGLEGSTVFVYHPAFGYFLDSFGLHQEAVETGGKEPTAKELANLIAEAKKDEAKAIFVQSQFPVFSAKKVAEAVGAKVVALDPLAYDWLANIRLMGDTLLEVQKGL